MANETRDLIKKHAASIPQVQVKRSTSRNQSLKVYTYPVEWATTKRSFITALDQFKQAILDITDPIPSQEKPLHIQTSESSRSQDTELLHSQDTHIPGEFPERTPRQPPVAPSVPVSNPHSKETHRTFRDRTMLTCHIRIKYLCPQVVTPSPPSCSSLQEKCQVHSMNDSSRLLTIHKHGSLSMPPLRIRIPTMGYSIHTIKARSIVKNPH